MRSGQRPQKHVRVVHGKAVLVNDEVSAPFTVPPSKKVGFGADALNSLVEDVDGLDGIEKRIFVTNRSPFDPSGEPGPGRWEVIYQFNPATKGGLLTVSGDGVTTSKVFEVEIGPNMPTLKGEPFFQGVDYSGSDLSGSSLRSFNAANCCFDNTNLSGTNIDFGYATGLSFRGANLKDAVLRGPVLNNVDMTGANFDGTDLGECTFAEKKEGHFTIDVRQSNFVPEVLARSGSIRLGRLRHIKYDKFDLVGVADALGLTADDVAVMVWAGDLEVRDNETFEVVEGVFDKNKHHVPQWALQSVVL